ncbi:hypothetical protein DL93DRAFT_1567861 [Clavulina sp. PMI_390]|nr:hypothetical protein DL93DRAFT_1567861 [Clavulina sp. PMI_390]
MSWPAIQSLAFRITLALSPGFFIRPIARYLLETGNEGASSIAEYSNLCTSLNECLSPYYSFKPLRRRSRIGAWSHHPTSSVIHSIRNCSLTIRGSSYVVSRAVTISKLSCSLPCFL